MRLGRCAATLCVGVLKRSTPRQHEMLIVFVGAGWTPSQSSRFAIRLSQNGHRLQRSMSPMGLLVAGELRSVNRRCIVSSVHRLPCSCPGQDGVGRLCSPLRDHVKSRSSQCYADEINLDAFRCALIFCGLCRGGGGGGGGGDLAGAKFGTAKCGTAKLYHILPWYLRTEATFFPLPNPCTFSLHYNPGHWEPVLAKNDFALNPVSQIVYDGSS